LFPTVGVPGAIAYRTGFSALILLVAFRPWRLPLTRADLFATMRYGAALGVMNFTFYMSLRTIPLGVAMAIEFLGPLGVSMWHSRRPSHFAMLALAIAGLGLLLPLRRIDHALDPVGVAFALCAALFWGLYIVLGKRTGHIPGGQAVALGMATAAVLVVPIGITTAGTTLLTPALVGIGLVVAILSSAVPYLLDMHALIRIPAYRYGVLMSADPAIAAIVGRLFLGERISTQQCIAIGLIVAASIGSVIASAGGGEKLAELV
jgi:inner membrane transporter RhtA